MTPNDDVISTKGCHPQTGLGPRALLKGLLHRQWRHEIEKCAIPGQISPMDKATNILAGLVVLLWKLQLQFWSTHTKSLHDESQDKQKAMNHKSRYYQQRIRELYAKRHQCLLGHQDQYFPLDLEEYLCTATTTQLKQYLHHYEPAIHQSIIQAGVYSQRPITSFPGFVRTKVREIRHQFSQSRRQTSPQPVRPRNPGARGAPTHHKHTRWRQISLISSLRSNLPSLRAPD